MKKLIGLALVVISIFVFAEDKEWILTETSIGTMPVAPKSSFSLDMIKGHFPNNVITHRIGVGDSPDFHIFSVQGPDAEVIISFISYIKSDNYEEKSVPLDEVVLYGANTRDEYGVSPGMLLKDAGSKRKKMKFGTGHMDNYLGDGKIWYLFNVGELHGEQVSYKKAIGTNPPVDVITWPYPRWR